MNSIKLGSKYINEDSLYFIADIGANHDGSLDKALELLHLAKNAGADAAKFQNFEAHKIVSEYGFQNLGTQLSHQSKWKKSVYEVYEDASISKNWTKVIKEECDRIGIDYFTSPYDIESVDHVDEYVDMYKIGSGDISWLEIIEYIIKKNKPVLIATGASNMDDVRRVMDLALSQTDKIILMQCNTNYTGSADNFNYCNLNVITTYRNEYPNLIMGLSDHTEGHSTIIAAIALGARVIEKHFTDNKKNDGPDHAFAMDASDWSEMVDRSYEALNALGDGEKRIEENEKNSFIVQRRCLRSSRSLKIGDILQADDIIALRPLAEDCIHPYEKEKLIGKKIMKNFEQGEHFSKAHIQL